MIECQICGSMHQMGPGIYDGKQIPAYKLQVCKTCFEANWDGWAPVWEEVFLEHLKKEGIEVPQRNAAGYFPRGL